MRQPDKFLSVENGSIKKPAKNLLGQRNHKPESNRRNEAK
jgi:hypothetical protein